jgi:hypothetical protein
MPKRIAFALATSVALAAAACAARTTVTQTWTSPQYHKSAMKKVLVLGIAKDGTIRRSYEDGFVEKLKSYGYEAIPAYEWVGDATKIDRDEIAAKIKENGVTHVLVTRMVGKKDVQTYVPPTTVGVGYGPGWYGGWYSYYSVGYSYVTQPGYITQDTVVTLETNLYDASKGEKDALMWSGTSDTWIGDSPAGSVKSVISAVAYKMRVQNIL